MLKTVLSALLFILHCACMVWYFSLSDEYKLINKSQCVLVFYGFGFIFISLNNLLRSDNDLYSEIEIYRYHNFFVLIIGTIYAVHYSGLLTTTTNEKLALVCTGIIVLFILIFYNLYRYGFFKRDKYL